MKMQRQLNSLQSCVSEYNELSKHNFGDDFVWGAATSSFQTEGNALADGKSESIWDRFSHKRGKIEDNSNGNIACDSYNRYETDIDLVRKLNLNAYRFSIAWTRILPEGYGKVNQKGIDYYKRVVEKCLERNINPWVTLYHWDLPQVLEEKGGWANRDILNWFNEYAYVCTKYLGDNVKNWMILNEPMAFTGLGYLIGKHAPGRRSLKRFFSSVHHATLCQAEGARVARENCRNAQIGTTFSFSPVDQYRNNSKDHLTSVRFDAVLNRLFIEPALGLGYPVNDFKALNRIYGNFKEGDEQRMVFDFDFIGVQNYTREVVKYSSLIPFLKGRYISPKKRGAPEITEMNWEVYPEGMYRILKKIGSYSGVKKIYITENGAAFPDILNNDSVNDPKRTNFIKDYLNQILKARQEGVNVRGYFVWSLLDNFEWSYGYKPRFGLVYVNFKNQDRIIKDSGYWLKEFLKD
jgi:beta-glucosidase